MENKAQNTIIDYNNIPEYIGIIMDGNGRWAKKQNKIRTFGHLAGINTLVNITDECQNLGIKELDVFAFSTENWKREESEVSFLMNAFLSSLDKYYNNIMSKKIRIKIYGEKNNLSKAIINKINYIEEQTKDFTNFTLGICFNYGFQDEIVNMVKKVVKEHNDANYNNVDYINKQYISNNLYCTHPLDLIIRTGGEYRLSNFLLWQAAYAELYFTNTYWPDFNKEELLDAILSYQKRDRRFGGIKNE